MAVAEYKKTYHEYKAELEAELGRTAEGFVRIGYLLKVARDTDILAESGYRNVTEFAKAEYGIDKTQVSRFIHINDRFSEGGYSECLAEHYKGFGYAKLTVMLQLPDALNEEITPEYSKAEIQAVRDEVAEEKRVTDLEVMLERAQEGDDAGGSILERTVRQLGEDDPHLYAAIWIAMRQQPPCPHKKLQEIMSPAGQKIYSVRVRGAGRQEMLCRDADNGDDVVLVGLRSGEKNTFTWHDLQMAWISITDCVAGTGYADAWEERYLRPFPEKKNVAPVQNEEKKPPKKEPKVQRAKTGQEKPENTVSVTVAGEEAEIPGQTSIEKDFPQYMPDRPAEKTEHGMENTQDGTVCTEPSAESRAPLQNGGAGKKALLKKFEGLLDAARAAALTGLNGVAREHLNEAGSCLDRLESMDAGQTAEWQETT